MDVISCNDSYSARRVIGSGPVDAVIADMNLSAEGGDCIDFIHYVRSCSRETPLIMMSALEDQKSNAFQEGANHFFEKPFDVEKLIAVLQDRKSVV